MPDVRGEPGSQRCLPSPLARRCLLFSISVSFATACLGQTISLEKYQGDLNKCLEHVQQAKANPGTAAASLRQARRVLPMRWQVMRAKGPAGETVTIPADKLLQELYAIETADKDVPEKLSRLEEALQWALEESGHDARPWHAEKANDARKQLDAILARSEFRRGASETLLDRLRTWIFYWIERALAALLPGAAKHGKWIGYIVWTALVLGALLVLYRFLRPYLGGKRKEAGSMPAEVEDRAGARRSAQYWMAEAWAQMETADYRRAIRAAYHAGLEFLITRDLLDYHPARTNREYLFLLRSWDELYGQFSGLTDQFERIWYGWRPCSRSDAEAFLAGIRTLEAPAS